MPQELLEQEEAGTSMNRPLVLMKPVDYFFDVVCIMNFDVSQLCFDGLVGLGELFNGLSHV